MARTLDGLARQTLAVPTWELIVVDNGSSPPLAAQPEIKRFARARLVIEPHAGLTRARLRGISEARGELIVFVDDDNVLAPDYLDQVHRLMTVCLNSGAAGGKVDAEWESLPPAWTSPFHGLLALADHGDTRLVAPGAPGAPWPPFAPVGAGLAVRRTHALAYAAAIRSSPARLDLDRRSGSLSSGGDNDLVFSILHAGADVIYEPALVLTHLIPAGRLDPHYLSRLNRGIMRSWVRVLALHGQCPWPPIPRWTVPVRAARAWVRRRAWNSTADSVRWFGDLGQFEGQADLAESAPTRW
jgi:glycosyltransferase involved in cell wall biosynthesis